MHSAQARKGMSGDAECVAWVKSRVSGLEAAASSGSIDPPVDTCLPLLPLFCIHFLFGSPRSMPAHSLI